MTVLSLQEAVERTGTSKVDIWRAIRAGTLSAKKTDDGGFAIDPAELSTVFETKQAHQCRVAEDTAPSLEASESHETSKTAETTDVTVVLAALTSVDELPAQAPARDEVPQDREERRAVDLVERNDQFAKSAPKRAKVEKMIQYAALANEHDRPWWRRLVGWIRTRRGEAARKRLRERL